jgi:hypothetical protein
MPVTFALGDARRHAAEHAATRARTFLHDETFPLGVAMIEHAWHGGSGEAVARQLSSYQNDDGGFGRGLEVDIESPASNPFAARLAMGILLSLDAQDGQAIRTALGRWLAENQHADGDWHFSEETRSGGLAPWFAGWTFPSLNPACCVAGLANRLGIATSDMLDRVAHLFESNASLDEAATGDFYALLPYVEYTSGIEWPERGPYLDAIASNIVTSDRTGTYADAGHFWEHVLGGGPDLVARLPVESLARNADLLLSEQEQDGGWPTPYSEAWRPLFTAQACLVLARVRDGV